MHARTVKLFGGMAILVAAVSLLGLAVFIYAMFPLSAPRTGRVVDWTAQVTIPSIGLRTSQWVIYVIPFVFLCIAALLGIGSVILLKRSHVKRAGLAIVLVMVVALSFSTYLFCYNPSRPGYLGEVSVTLRGFQTNASRQITALVAVSNAGPYALELPFGCQVMMGKSDGTGVMHRSDGDAIIAPGQVSYVSVIPPSEPSYWRVQAHCVKSYSPGWLGRMNSFVDIRVLKRQVWETASTPEVFK